MSFDLFSPTKIKMNNLYENPSYGAVDNNGNEEKMKFTKPKGKLSFFLAT